MLRREENATLQAQQLPAVGSPPSTVPNRPTKDNAMKHVLRVRPSFIRLPRMEMPTR